VSSALEGKCYCCGKGGHKSPTCRFKSRPKNEWAVNKAQNSFAQATIGNDQPNMMNNPVQEQTKQTPEMSTKMQGTWAGTHIEYGLYQTETMRNWVLLDNQLSATVLCNKDC
jgi:hypothetical protein